VTIKLKTATVTVQPGQPVPISLKLSSAVRKKYAGKTLTATTGSRRATPRAT
jgi:hypothetical protein